MQNETAKIIRFHETGGPEVLRIEELPLPIPGQGEVRLRVHAFGLNRAETLFRKGLYRKANLPTRLGYEASGIVEAVGPGVDTAMIGRAYSSFPNFDFSKYGVYGEVAILPATSLAPFPEKLSFTEAASIWMAYITAYGPLVHIERVRPGDFVVITAASSSVGLAAIDITRAQGGISIATTRRAAKREQLLLRGADHVIVTDEEDVASRILEITNGVGARIFLDAVGGENVRELAKAACAKGVIFIHGILSMQVTPFPLVLSLWKGLTMRGFEFYEITADPTALSDAERYIYQHLDSGAFVPTIAKTFTLDQIVEAHRYMETGKHVGKIVINVTNGYSPMPSIF